MIRHVPELTGATIAGLLLGLTARHWVPRLLAADRRVDVLVRDRIRSKELPAS